MRNNGSGDGGDARVWGGWWGGVGFGVVSDDASGSRRARGSRLQARFRAALSWVGRGRARAGLVRKKGTAKSQRDHGVGPWMESSAIETKNNFFLLTF
jgi:hypothetical protein